MGTATALSPVAAVAYCETRHKSTAGWFRARFADGSWSTLFASERSLLSYFAARSFIATRDDSLAAPAFNPRTEVVGVDPEEELP